LQTLLRLDGLGDNASLAVSYSLHDSRKGLGIGLNDLTDDFLNAGREGREGSGGQDVCLATTHTGQRVN
jgi:hypothetical protein